MTPLSDAGYERLLMEVLEGVTGENWTRDRVLVKLGGRQNDRFFLSWFDRFGRRLLSSSMPHQQLSDRLLRLGALQCGEVSAIARKYGTELHQRDLPELKPHEYEPLFRELLRRTTESEVAVSAFLADLSQRVTVSQWVMWLRGYQEKLLAEPEPDLVTAKGLLRLAEALEKPGSLHAETEEESAIADLVQLSRQIGEELRSREVVWEVWEYGGEDRVE
jgi:hypothetical protein